LVLKKQEFKDDEIAIFDEVCVYKRGEYGSSYVLQKKINTHVKAYVLAVKKLLSESRKNQYNAHVEKQMQYACNNELKQVLRACSRRRLIVFNGTNN